jgi:hypothetical protein
MKKAETRCSDTEQWSVGHCKTGLRFTLVINTGFPEKIIGVTSANECADPISTSSAWIVVLPPRIERSSVSE